MSMYRPPVEQHDNLVKAALRVIAATHYSRADNPYADAEHQYAAEQLAIAAKDLAEAVEQRPADEQPVGWVKPGEEEAIHTHFGLSYANYLVLPRTLLQSMPDAWQARFVALIDELEEAFQHVEQPEAYKVEAATEHIVSEMTDLQLKMARIKVDRYGGEAPPDGLSAEELLAWEEQHETDPRYYDEHGAELDPQERVLLPTADPVPYYNRGRTRVEPRLDGAR
jgi:hypothetical protein